MPSASDRPRFVPACVSRSVYDDLPEEEEKGLLERVVFGITIGGIAFLIFVEIFINTPVFQQIKPFILKIMPN